MENEIKIFRPRKKVIMPIEEKQMVEKGMYCQFNKNGKYKYRKDINKNYTTIGIVLEIKDNGYLVSVY